MQRLLDRLQNLIRIPSVTGYEYPFFISLKRELEQMGVEVRYYDGVLVANGKNPTSGYISAHSDRHGLVCTGENEFQYAAYIAKNRADLEGNSISEQTFQDLVGRFCNQQVFSYEARSGLYHSVGIIQDAYLCARRANMIFNIKGLESSYAGTPVAFNDMLKRDGDFLSAQLDNVISVALILYLYELGYEGSAFFTSSEEAGRSWRFLLEWFKRYDVKTKELLVLDTSSFVDKNELDLYDVVLRNKDANSSFNENFVSHIKNICAKNNIKYVFKDEYILKNNELNNTKKTIGSTELGRVVKGSFGEINGATLQLPTINYHTTSETTSIKALEKMVEILKELYL